MQVHACIIFDAFQGESVAIMNVAVWLRMIVSLQ